MLLLKYMESTGEMYVRILLSLLSFLHSLHPSPLPLCCLFMSQRMVALKKVRYTKLIEAGKAPEWVLSKFILEVALMRYVHLHQLKSTVMLIFLIFFLFILFLFLYSKLNCNTYFVPLYGAVIQPPYLYLGKHFFLLSSAPLTFPLSFLLSPSSISYYQEINSFFSSPRVHVWRKFVPGPKFRR